MNLVRLLKTGKSFVGGIDTTNRFRMGPKGMLPKFGTNPFTEAAEGQDNFVELTKPPTQGETPLSLPPATTPRRSGADGGRPSAAPAVSGGPERAGAGEPRLASALVSVIGLLSRDARKRSRLEPKAPRSGKGKLALAAARSKTALSSVWKAGLQKAKRLAVNPFARSGKPRAQRVVPGAVQTELSLDNVRVLRNDLSDTDLDVMAVPARPPSINSKLEIGTRTSQEIQLQATPCGPGETAHAPLVTMPEATPLTSKH
jgi:hypothetical protein